MIQKPAVILKLEPLSRKPHHDSETRTADSETTTADSQTRRILRKPEAVIRERFSKLVRAWSNHGWPMDAPFSERIRPWTSSWLLHGCSFVRMRQTMDVIVSPTWVISCQVASDHGRYHGWAMDNLGSGRIRPWT